MHDETETARGPLPGGRLPRTIAHWLASHGLRVTHRDGVVVYARSRRRAHVAGCAEPERRFRFMAHVGVMQVCDGHFDRWANSVGAEAPMPLNKREFDEAFPLLLATATVAEPTAETMKGHFERRIEWAGEAIGHEEERLGYFNAVLPPCRRLRGIRRMTAARIAGKRAEIRQARRGIARLAEVRP